MEAAGTLAVQAKVLRVRLGDAKLEALLDKVANGPAVGSKVTRCEALVCRVKEGKVLLRLDHLSNLLPLLLGSIDTGRVVGACVQNDNATLGRILQSTDHAIEVEALGLLGEVRVCLVLEADVGEDLEVVGPCGVGKVDCALRLCLVELCEEEGTEVDGAGAGDGLQAGDLGGVSSSHDVVE